MNYTGLSKRFEKGAGFMRGVSHVTTSSPRCCGWETWEAARWVQIRPETDVPESAAVSRADLQTLCLPFPSYTASKTHNTTSKLSFKLIYNISQTLVRSSHLYISVQWITMNQWIRVSVWSYLLAGSELQDNRGAVCKKSMNGVRHAVQSERNRLERETVRQTCRKEKCQKENQSYDKQ